ncbi:MAG: serine/threonine-protein kinase [Polyangiales bacterium]
MSDVPDSVPSTEQPTRAIKPGTATPLTASSRPQAVDVGDSSLVLPGEATTPSQVLDVDSIGRAALDFRSRYLFRYLLGEGGMGEVHLVRDRTVGRDVALKVIRGDDPESRARAQARFVREARVQGQLEHPSIVPVYDFGSNPDGNLYFTMKRVRGRSLQQIFRGLNSGDAEIEELYPRRRLLKALQQTCLTMAFAHTRGVLHRDLKPANIMLGDFGEVYVLDWGLAKTAGADELEAEENLAQVAHENHTVDGAIVGTPGFMAPEQLKGADVVVDERADVYALGAILFQILTRRALHEGETFNDYVISTLSPAPRASVAAPDGGVPPELDSLCAEALKVLPEERIASAALLSETLEAYLDGDHDLTLRRKAAQAHAANAERVLEGRAHSESTHAAKSADDTLSVSLAGVDEEGARRHAMREVGAALGLDPTNETALHTFYRLLTEPPDEMPAEAAEELRKARLEAKRVGLKVAMVVYASFIGIVPLVLFMGVKNWVAFTVEGVSIGACFLLSVYHYRRDQTPAISLDHIVAATIAVIVSIVVLGPFMVVPTLALANTAAYAVAAHKPRERFWIATMGVCAVIVPVLVEFSGLLPPTFDVVDGQIIVHSMMFELSFRSTLAFLLIIHVPFILACAWFVARVKETHSELERQMRVQAWQLAQIVPSRPDSRE